MVDEVLIFTNNVCVLLSSHHFLIKLILAYTVANNTSFPFKPQTLSAYKTLENRQSTNKQRKEKTHLHNSALTGHIYVPYKLHQLRSLAWISVEAWHSNMKGWAEDDYVESQSGPISGTHTPPLHAALSQDRLLPVSRGACRRRGDRERVVFILHEGGAGRLKAAAAAGDRSAQRDWLHGLWKLSLGAEE